MESEEEEGDDDGAAERQRRSADASTSGHERHPSGAAAADGSAAPEGEDSELLTEKVAPRDLSELPPLFTRLQERRAEALHYLGVSFGLTAQLLKFWQRLGFAPVYLRQTASDVTGEHTCIVLKALAAADVQDAVRSHFCKPCDCPCAGNVHVRGARSCCLHHVAQQASVVTAPADMQSWLAAFGDDFKGRLLVLLSGAFRDLPPATTLSLLQPQLTFSAAEASKATEGGVTVVRQDGKPLNAYDLKRLQVCASALVIALAMYGTPVCCCLVCETNTWPVP